MTTKTIDFTNHELAFSGAQEQMLQEAVDQTLEAVDVTVDAHINDTTAAHASTAIGLASTLFPGQADVKAGLEHLAGTSRTTETVKGNADKITLTDLYPVIAQGFNTTGAAGNTAIDNKPSNRTPAITDTVVMITGVVTATGVPVAAPAIVTADTAQGVMVNPVSDTGIKIRWGKAGGGVDYSPNTYTIWLKPA